MPQNWDVVMWVAEVARSSRVGAGRSRSKFKV